MLSSWRRLGYVLLLSGIALGGADDDYIAIYRILSRAESEQIQSHTVEARSCYLDARERLLALHRAYPTWNEKVIGYRLRFIEEKLGELGYIEPGNGPDRSGQSPTRSSVTPGTSAPPSLAPEGEVLEQFNRLNQQILELTQGRQTLEAKLREALSAQPAPVDPQELRQAVEKIGALQATNQALSRELQVQVAARKNLVDKVVADEARQALEEANRQLALQRTVVVNLARERSDLTAELKRLKDGELKGLKSENSSLKAQVSELRTDTDKGRQIADLTARLSKLQERIDAADKEKNEWQADKAKLEKQAEDFRTHQVEESSVRIRRLETDLAVAQADASRQGARVQTLMAQVEGEKGTANQLRHDNQELVTRMKDLTNRMEDAQKAEAALINEKSARQELEAQLASAEQRLKVAAIPSGAGLTDDGTPAEAEALAARAAQAGVLEKEVERLRVALKQTRERESSLLALLADADRQRDQLGVEKAELLDRVRQLEKTSARVNPASPTPAAYQKLEARVRELEKQRDDMARKLADAAGRSSTAEFVGPHASLPVTPREKAVEFRQRRSP